MSGATSRGGKPGGAARFPLLDEFCGVVLGLNPATVRPGHLEVVECPRRLEPERSYGFVRAALWLCLDDGRGVVSVPPGAGDAVRRTLGGACAPGSLWDPEAAKRLQGPVDAALRQAGRPDVERLLRDLVFACDATLLKRPQHRLCERVRGACCPSAPGAELPARCFPDGVVYGVIEGGRVVSVAYAHRTGVMEDRVADLGVGTAEGYRRCGYARSCVSAVVEHVARSGGEARYCCSPDNAASIATARSVGFVPYGRSLVLSAPLGAT